MPLILLTFDENIYYTNLNGVTPRDRLKIVVFSFSTLQKNHIKRYDIYI